MRKHYLDNIRWITVLLVLIYHVIYMYNGVQLFGVIGPFREVQYQDAYQYLVYPWFMALLFVVSGISAKYYLDGHDTREFIRTRTRKLLVPSTLGLLVFQWIQGYYNMQIGDAFSTMPMDQIPGPVVWLIMSVSGIGVLWYIQTLWILSLLLIPVRKLEKGRLSALCEKVNLPILLLLTVVVYPMAHILNTPVITVYRFGLYGFCFFAGYFIFSNESVIERVEKAWPVLTVMALASGIGYTILYFGENYAVEPTINCPLACVYCWLGILAMLAVGKRFLDRTSGIGNWMNQKAWGLYMFHYLPISMVAFYLREAGFGNAFLSYFLCLIAGFWGAILLYEVIRKIPVLRWFVLGIRKEKTHVQG